ncbi:MAG TPA: hypothetical protein VF599_07435 [Pyrinomonadaceae bacterium]|jgi:Ca2+/Na+ antiporter
MTPDKLLSPSEHKLFFGIAFLICCLFFVNLTNKTINSYNEAIENAQIEKRYAANSKPKISFGIYCLNSTPLYEVILALQFFTNPLLLLLFLKRKAGRFICAGLLAAFTFSGYVGWIIYTYRARKSDESFYRADTSFNDYLLYNSTFPEFILFLIFAVLLVLQICVLTRFVIEKFQARIYLR